MKKVFFILTLLLILTGCATGNAVKGAQSIPKETNKPIEVYFCPADDCNKILAGFISSAESSVHCALFDINLKDVINALAEKSYAADVKIVVDNNNYGEITGPGVRQDDNNQLSHNKFCVIDGEKISTGSFNPTERDAYKNNNNLLIIYSKLLAKNYEDEFKELWNGSYGEGGKVKTQVIYFNDIKIENYFCPEDSCSRHVIEKIRDAKKSVYFMTFSFTDEGIADAMLFNDKIDIKGVFETLEAGSDYSQYHRLKGFGLDVKKDSNKYNMHHKVLIIDGEMVITGSYNPTGAGNYKNDENMLIIHDKSIASKFLEEFDRVWGWES